MQLIRAPSMIRALSGHIDRRMQDRRPGGLGLPLGPRRTGHGVRLGPTLTEAQWPLMWQ